MPHPLDDRLSVLRRRITRLLWLYGLGAVAAIGGAMVIGLGLLDYTVRWEDPGLRVMLSFAALGVLLWSAYRCLYLPLMARIGRLALARRVQQRFPQLSDRLVSAVEFLHQNDDDPLAGSAALRRRVVRQVAAESTLLDFGTAVDRRPTIRAMVLATGMCLGALALAAVDPVSARIALARLTKPWQAIPWPQATHLALVDSVSKIARGHAFEVEVREADGGRLPTDMQIHYRLETSDGRRLVETEPMHVSADRAVARRQKVVRPFAYRVVGGDDRSMPWQPVEVVDPPGFGRIMMRLIPPAYTGWRSRPVQGHLRALAGTRLEIVAEAARPLRSATLELGETEVPAALSEDGLRATFPGPREVELILEQSATYRFTLIDRDGLRGETEPWEIEVTADAAPSVALEQPDEDVFLTPSAIVPLRIAAKDDLAVRWISLFHEAAPGSEPIEPASIRGALPLYEGPAAAPPPVEPTGTGVANGELRTVEHRWDLSPLGVKPGMQLVIEAEAVDYLDQKATSPPRRLIVIAAEELAERLAGSQDAIVAELARAAQSQREARSQVEAFQTRLEEAESLKPLDIDRLQATELQQREVVRSLTDRSEGVPRHLHRVLADLRNNRVDSPDVRRRMQELLDRLTQLQREQLVPLRRELTAALKAAENAASDNSSPAGDPALADALASTHQRQGRVIAALEELLKRLAQWDRYRRFHREVTDLRRDQQRLAQRARELGRQTLTKELQALASRQRAELKELADRQAALARRLDRLQQQMEQTAAELRDTDPSAANTMADALGMARRLGIASTMRLAEEDLQRNRMGQAVARHGQIASQLGDILDILANRGGKQDGTQPAGGQLAELGKKVTELQQEQETVLTETRRLEGLRKSSGELERSEMAAIQKLAQKQRALQAMLADTTGSLQQASPFRFALDVALDAMGRAATQLARWKTDAATQQAEQEAVDRLAMVREAIEAEPAPNADASGQPEQGRGEGPTLKVTELRLVKLLQEDLNRRTRRLHDAVAGGSPADDQRAQLAALRDRQGRLADVLVKMLEEPHANR